MLETVRLLRSQWTLRDRRIMAFAFTSIVTVIWLLVHQWIVQTLGHAVIYSGATLLTCLLVLVLLGLRKRLIVLPIWNVSTWVQIHLYVGLFSCVAFVAHVPTIIASGRFESPLAWLFLIVAGSGFYGLYLSRTAPKKLTNLTIQPRYDQLSWHRDQLSLGAAATIDELNEASPSTPILKAFYTQTLAPYLSSTITMGYRLMPSSGMRRRLLAQLSELDRYLDAETLWASRRLAALVRHRDDLNYHHAIQFRMRAWVLVHSSLSIVLVFASVVHAALAIGMLGA